MSSVVISGDSSGTITLSAPSVAGSNTLTLPASTGTVGLIAQGTAVATTSGTAVDFTGIPSWIKQITVMLSGVSTSGTSNIQIQIGSGSVTTTGYVGTTWFHNTAAISSSSITTGLGLLNTGVAAASTTSGLCNLVTLGSNVWTANAYVTTTGGGGGGATTLTLGGVLDRIRITTVNGTDTFDAGSVNIMYQG